MNTDRNYVQKGVSLLISYWREVAVVIMFLVLQSQISDVRQSAENAYNAASDAADSASQASSDAQDASSNASDAADYCSQLQ